MICEAAFPRPSPQRIFAPPLLHFTIAPKLLTG
jgi:hypothetical protein